MVTVSFGGPLEFGVAGLGDSVPRDAQNDGVPADAIVTASIAPASTLFSIASVTAYNVAVVDVPPGELPPGHVGPPPKQRVYTETRHSDGKAPLFVLKGQAVGVRVALTVPTSAVMPGDVAATLTIQGDTWDQAAAVALRGSLLAVDESTPIGEKWRELGALAFSGAVLANAQTMSDGLGAFQTFSNGAIVYSPDFGAVWLAQPVFAKLNAPEVAQGRSASGDNIRDYLGYPTDDTFPTIEPGGHVW
jgi:LGFP repeat